MVMQGELVWYELPHLFWNTWQQIPHSWMCVYLYIKLFSSCNSIQKKIFNVFSHRTGLEAEAIKP